MVWCAADDSWERWHIPKHVKLLDHGHYCFVSAPGGTRESRPNRSELIDMISCSSIQHNPPWRAVRASLRSPSPANSWQVTHIILLPGRNPTAHSSLETYVFIDFRSASINRRIKGAWQKSRTHSTTFMFSFTNWLNEKNIWSYYWLKCLFFNSYLSGH